MKHQIDISEDVEIPVVTILIAVFYLVYGSWCYAKLGLLGTLIATAMHLFLLLFYLIILNTQGGKINGKPKQLSELH